MANVKNAQTGTSKTKTSLQVRMEPELAQAIKAARPEGQSLNVFITQALDEHLDRLQNKEHLNKSINDLSEELRRANNLQIESINDLSKELRKANNLKIAQYTTTTMLRWNDLVAEHLAALKGLVPIDGRVYAQFKGRAYEIYVEPATDEDEKLRKAGLALLNILESICYGVSAGAIDKKAAETMPIEAWAFTRLMPLWSAFRLEREEPGWIILEQYLREIKGDEEFDRVLKENIAICKEQRSKLKPKIRKV